MNNGRYSYKIADLIDPEVMGDMISAKLPKKIKVAPLQPWIPH